MPTLIDLDAPPSMAAIRRLLTDIAKPELPAFAAHVEPFMLEITTEHTMTPKTHNCAGAILTGTIDGAEYRYCDDCGAFTYDAAASVPSGTDADANKAAWDAGDDQSPAPQAFGPPPASRIRALRAEAGVAGDLEAVDICNRALAGAADAAALVAEMLDSAAAQADGT